MMRFLEGTDLTKVIRQVVAAGPVDMAVAFWGNEAVERLALPETLTGYRIACDAYSGACSPTTLTTLLNRGALIVDVPGVHAKVYRSKVQMVVGSANASTNGLSEDAEALSGLEAGAWTNHYSPLESAGEWLDKMFAGALAEGRRLKAEHIPEIARLWKIRRIARPLRATLADAVLRNAPALRDRTEQAYLYTTEAPPAGVSERYQQSPSFDRSAWRRDVWPFFWGDLAGAGTGDILLCFEREKRRLDWAGAWLVQDPLEDEGVQIWPCKQLYELMGMPLGNMDDVARLADTAIETGRLFVDVGPISLADFAQALRPGFEGTHLARIRTEPVREAYRLLIGEALRMRLASSPKSGHVPAVRLHDVNGRYAFSFNVNTRDLLFYLRDPAIEASPGLVERAANAGFTIEIPQERSPRKKPKTERQIRIAAPEEAKRLAAWLATELPLPAP
jgi:hypothetical protein